ncbi:MAG: T9SS type A sorting domain-containing protein [Sphingobacteriales bacterium]|nr:MAG: T9SS type A sorting domain-containing protein [Sphingobacteriales bacterium]
MVVVKRSPTLHGTLTVAPQPMSHTFTILSTEKMLEGTEAVVIDMQGREVKRLIVRDGLQVEVKGWPVGMYLLRLADGSTVRLVKN